MNRPPCFHGNSLLPDQWRACCLNACADRQIDRRTDGRTVWEPLLQVSINVFTFQLCSISLHLNLEIFDLPFSAEQQGTLGLVEKKKKVFLPLSQPFCQQGAAVPDGTFQVNPSTLFLSLKIIIRQKREEQDEEKGGGGGGRLQESLCQYWSVQLELVCLLWDNDKRALKQPKAKPHKSPHMMGRERKKKKRQRQKKEKKKKKKSASCMMWKADLGLLLCTLQQGLKEILSKHIWLPEITVCFASAPRAKNAKADDFQTQKYSGFGRERARERVRESERRMGGWERKICWSFHFSSFTSLCARLIPLWLFRSQVLASVTSWQLLNSISVLLPL